MARDTLTTLANVLVETWEPTIEALKRLSDPILTEILPKEGRDVKVGKGLNILKALEISPPQGMGARSDDEDFQVGVPGTYTPSYIPMKFLHFVHEFSEHAIVALASGGQDENGMTLDEILAGLTTEYARDKARQLWSDGSGILAQVNGAGANTVTMPYDNARNGWPLFPLGMLLDVCQYSTSTSAEDTSSVSSVTENWEGKTGSITLATVSTWTDSYYIFRSGNNGREMVGCLAAFDDGTYTNTFNSVSGSTYPDWYGNVYANGGTGRAITEELLGQAMRGPAHYGHEVEIGACNGVGWDRIGLLLAGKVQIVPTSPDVKLYGGWSAIYFRGKPIVISEQAPQGKFIWMKKSRMNIIHPMGYTGGFMPGPGQPNVRAGGKGPVLLTRYSTTTGNPRPGKVIIYREFANLYCPARRIGARIDDLDWTL